MDETVEALQTALDENPECAVTRGVLADRLEELGDPRAAGYRELSRLGRSPVPIEMAQTSPVEVYWIYGTERNTALRREYARSLLPPDWADRVPETFPHSAQSVFGGGERARMCWRYYESRRAADDAAAEAFVRTELSETREEGGAS